MDIFGSSAVAEFYDGLADDYHLIYADRWELSLRHQRRVLDALIRSSVPEAHDVLDCACRVGTQATGLALLGSASLEPTSATDHYSKQTTPPHDSAHH